MDDIEINNSEEKKNFNTKIIIIAIVSVLLGAAFVLSLITFGMNVQRKFDIENATQREKTKTVSIINLEYEEASFGYALVFGDGRHEDGMIVPTMVERLGGVRGNDYYVINSSDKLESTLNLIRHNGEYSADASFFKSGSIIAVPVEKNVGYIDCRVKNVVRDENYNITIDIEYKNSLDPSIQFDDGNNSEDDELESNEGAVKGIEDSSTFDVAYNGQLVLVKLSNIQPKHVTVNLSEKKN